MCVPARGYLFVSAGASRGIGCPGVRATGSCEGPCGCWEQNSARLREISVPNCSASAYKRKGQFRSYKDAASLVLSSETFLLSKPLCFLAASEGSTPSLDQYSWFLLAPVHVCKVKVQLCTESVLYKLARAPCQEGFLPSVNEAIFYNCSAWCRLPSNEELNRNRWTKKARAFRTQLPCRLALIRPWHCDTDWLPRVGAVSVFLAIAKCLGTFFCGNNSPSQVMRLFLEIKPGSSYENYSSFSLIATRKKTPQIN